MKTCLIRFAAPLLGVATLVFLSGCATLHQEQRISQRTSEAAFERQEAASSPTLPTRSFVVNDGFYAAKKPLATVPVNARAALPANFFKDASMNDQKAVSLTEIAARITTRLGYVVAVDQDVLVGKAGTSPGAAPASVVPTAAPQALPPLPGADADPGLVSAPALPPLPTVPTTPPALVLPEFIFSGNLVGLLDTLTGKLNLSWRWTGDRIEIFRFETKMFRLDALAGTVSNKANLNTTSTTGSASGGSGGSGGNSGASSTGTSGQTTSVTSNLEVWDDVEKALKGVSSKDGTLTLSPSAGIITVRDTPAVLRQVEAMIAEFNRLYTRQVVLNIEVYAIERSAGDQYGIDWKLVYDKASKYGYTLNSLGGLGGGTSGQTGGQAFSFTRGGAGQWSGSNVLVQALSSVGKTSLMTSNSVIAMNGQTVPLNVAREQAYLQSYSTTLNTGTSGGQTTTLTPGVVTDGVSMNFTPRILEDNNVILRYAIDLSTTEEITNFVSPDGNSAIQLPRRAVRNFLQNVTVHSGDTLVLTGFQQLQGGEDGTGPGSPKAWFLGGSRKANTLARTIVIVVTPYVTGS